MYPQGLVGHHLPKLDFVIGFQKKTKGLSNDCLKCIRFVVLHCATN